MFSKKDTYRLLYITEREPEMDDLDLMTGEQLKALCKDRGLKSTGKKDVLKQRIKDFFLQGPNEAEGKLWFVVLSCDVSVDSRTFIMIKTSAGVIAADEDELTGMTLPQLKALCKEKGLKVSGKKGDLQERLRAEMPPKPSAKDDWDLMTENDLRDALAARNLSRKGNRDDLLQRLRVDDAYAAGMIKSSDPQGREDFIALSDLLEEAASKEDGSTLAEILAEIKQKSQTAPKYVDVTVTSINLDPIKYTAGGAPSVTADVLKTLAGDPFADPPKYGTVSPVQVRLLHIFFVQQHPYELLFRTGL
jgi:SAP domain